ncbi:molecular chaperone TorD [Psychromonas ossibalaenae]|uniref:molecular chaperone TorD n=1 Tax=Psychromonas ossibalaenae TaxID=444922 RepID=UPI00035CE6AA|nr:molecular chaperone TorD [Psychromonas ossibalaenae]
MTETTISEINETRASLYWWFATLLTKELDKEQLAMYFCGEGVTLLDQLEQEPDFTASVQKIKSALTAILAMNKPELELAADFSQIFLTDTKTGAPPYASVYLSKSGQLFEQPHQDMIDLFKAQGLVVDPSFNEPADHIAIQLDYLGNLIIQDVNGVSEAQINFIEVHILSWLEQFVKATAKVNNSGFYQGVCQLLQAYIKQDIVEIMPD